jgi:hypothetical protein
VPAFPRQERQPAPVSNPQALFLEDAFGDFRVSKRRLRQVGNIQLVRHQRDTAQQHLGFASRPFVLCGLPIRRVPLSSLVYESRNGLFTLQITGHPDFGLPFGQDRLVPIFLATLAVRQQSQTIRFKSAAQMLDTFGMAKGGKEYRRLIAAFERIFGATIFFGTDSTRPRAQVIRRSRFNFLREAQIWYNRNPAQGILSDDFENVIVLSDEFFDEVMAHPIPADIEVVKVFGSAPAVLDLFMWLTYRCSSRRRKSGFRYLGISDSLPTRICGIHETATIPRHARTMACASSLGMAGMPCADLLRR